MLEMDFPPSSFDIIWTEGAISFIGFERGLSEWRDLVISCGYIVVHDVLSDLQKKNGIACACGYTILGQFELPTDTWWNEYYAPLKRKLEALQGTDSRDKRVIEEIKTAEREIKDFDFGCDRFGSVFFVLKKT